ncbi:MAG: hypothetical protein RLN99_02135 [Kiloniellaceae bacterium]
MYEPMDAHPITLIVIMAALLVTPFYLLCTYVFSGASARKGALAGGAFLIWGAAMTWFCLAGILQGLGPLGSLVVPVCWLTPSLILLLRRDWFLDTPLSQRWLIGLQLWRVIGGVFLIEMVGGNIPGVFAYPAGLGDILVAAVAATVLIFYRNRDEVPRAAVLLVFCLGVADFLSAFFFGFTSSVGPQQLFFPAVANNSLMFPTGMIPLFLVPYAIFFHTLSILALRQREAGLRRLTARPGPEH